jgi:hypothetical protein
MMPAVAAQNISLGPCQVYVGGVGELFEAMARIAPPQPNEALVQQPSGKQQRFAGLN